MKKLMVMLAILLTATVSQADDVKIGEVLQKIPGVKTGFAYSAMDHAMNYTSTVEVANFGKYINVDVGWAGASQEINHRLVGGVSFNLLESGFIKFPILKYVSFQPSLLGGMGDINVQDLKGARWDFLVGANILNIKW